MKYCFRVSSQWSEIKCISSDYHSVSFDFGCTILSTSLKILFLMEIRRRNLLINQYQMIRNSLLLFKCPFLLFLASAENI